LAAAIAFVQPEGAIVMDEGNTSSVVYRAMNVNLPRHTCLTQTGGAIGLGLPCATGAALACPTRPVIVIQADGSALYNIQALWTQARERLNVTSVICNNGGYRVLGIELARAGVQPGPQARKMMALSQPAPDFVRLAEGFGVPGKRAEDAGALVRCLQEAIREPGPHLIDALLTDTAS
jgi:acetolactate synthase-1/2/3 large subunit